MLLLAAWTVSGFAQTANNDRWDGTIVFGDLKLPFSMQLKIKDGKAAAAFTNLGEVAAPVASTSGTATEDAVKLRFEALHAILEGNLDGGSLKGVYRIEDTVLKVDAGRFCTCGFQGEAGPEISGVWTIDGGGKLTIRRTGEDTIGVLTTGAGTETPALAGRFDGAVFTLSYFDGDPSRAAWLEIEPSKDGKALDISFRQPGKEKAASKMRAVRSVR